MRKLLHDVAERSADYLEGLAERPVAPSPDALERLGELGGELPGGSTDPAEVLAMLDEIGSPATVASSGPRYFGFVIGGSLPAAVAADWLATVWDNNAGLRIAAPVGAHLEDIALGWLVDVLGLPPGTGGGFTTGATMANLTGLAAARHRLLDRVGWDVQGQGLFGAPELRVVVGDEVHVSVLRALSLLGLGRDRVVRVPVDGQGRMRADALPELDDRTILCVQAGNVNTGAFDPLEPITAAAEAAGSWVHVDGAFGLWAAAAPERRGLIRGVERRRLVGDRRPQVAQRAVRQRAGLRARSRGAPQCDAQHGRLPLPGSRRASPSTTCPSCHVGHAASTCGPPFVRSAARAWRP